MAAHFRKHNKNITIFFGIATISTTSEGKTTSLTSFMCDLEAFLYSGEMHYLYNCCHWYLQIATVKNWDLIGINCAASNANGSFWRHRKREPTRQKRNQSVGCDKARLGTKVTAWVSKTHTPPHHTHSHTPTHIHDSSKCQQVRKPPVKLAPDQTRPPPLCYSLQTP